MGRGLRCDKGRANTCSLRRQPNYAAMIPARRFLHAGGRAGARLLPSCQAGARAAAAAAAAAALSAKCPSPCARERTQLINLQTPVSRAAPSPAPYLNYVAS